MNIRTKISLGYQIVLSLLIVLTLYLLYNVDQMLKVNQTLTEINFASIEQERELRRLIGDLQSYDEKYLLGFQAYFTAIREVRNDLRRPIARLRQTAKTEKEQKLLQVFEHFLARYEATFDHEVYQAERLKPETVTAAAPNLLKEKSPLVDHLTDLLRQMETSSDLLIDEQIATVQRQTRLTRQLSLVVALLALGVAVGFTFFITRQISKRLGRLQDGMKQITAGNLDATVRIRPGDELHTLAEGFNMMSRRLKELEELKGEFLSHVSHELKSPLASIIESSNLLLEGLPGPVSEDQRKLLQITKEKARRLLHMINDLLDVTRIESGVMEYNLEPVDLVDLLERDIEGIKPLALEKGIEIGWNFQDPDVVAPVDKLRLSQAVHNLLSNAIKFTPEGGKIEISLKKVDRLGEVVPSHVAIEAGIRGGSGVLLGIEDTGVGIDQDEVHKIFEKFYRARAGKQLSTKGTGLGLAITRNIVAAHRGAIWAESELGHGTVFYIALPAGHRKEVRAVSIR